MLFLRQGQVIYRVSVFRIIIMFTGGLKIFFFISDEKFIIFKALNQRYFDFFLESFTRAGKSLRQAAWAWPLLLSPVKKYYRKNVWQ